MFSFISSLFRSVDEIALTNATLAFGNRFYNSLRADLDVSDEDAIPLSSELPLMAVSVVNAFIGLRKHRPRRLMAKHTQNALMAYGIHFEKITKGRFEAIRYSTALAQELAKTPPLEYTRIVVESTPECQPELLVQCFIRRTETRFVATANLDVIHEHIASSLSTLISDLREAGV